MSEFDAVGMALWLVAFWLSATCHEAAHALVAKLGGDPTAYQAGQVTLNPLVHAGREPFGMVLFPIGSFFLFGWMIGWASAPYDPDWAARHPRRAALMAAAGPFANALLLVLAVVALKVAVGAGWAVPPSSGMVGIGGFVTAAGAEPVLQAVIRFLGILAVLNALLATFNMMPLPPLDGAAIVEGLGGAPAKRVMDAFREMPMASLVGLVVAWRLFSWIAIYVFRGVQTMVYA